MSTLPTDPNFVFEVHQRQDSLFGEMEKRLYEVARESHVGQPGNRYGVQ